MWGGPLSLNTSNETVRHLFRAFSCTKEMGDLRSSSSEPSELLPTLLDGDATIDARDVEVTTAADEVELPFVKRLDDDCEVVAAAAAVAAAAGCPGTKGSEAGFKDVVVGWREAASLITLSAFVAAECLAICAELPSPKNSRFPTLSRTLKEDKIATVAAGVL
jgi:hypothetical protein